MLEKLYSYILSGYSDSSIHIRKKTKALLNINLILLAGLIIVIPLSVLTGIDISMILSLSGVAIVYVVSIIFLKYNNFTIAVNIHLIFTALMQTSSVIFSGTHSGIDTVYMLSFFIAITLLDAALVSNRFYQPISVTAIGIIGIIILIFSKILPNESISHLYRTFPFFILLILCGVIAVLVLKQINSVIVVAEKEIKSSKSRYNKLKDIIEKMEEGINIGEKLTKSTETTMNTIKDIDKSLSNVREEMVNLSNEMQTSEENANSLVETTKSMKDTINEQTTLISESSASIEEMTSSINNISEITKSKKESITELVKTTDEGEKEMNKAIDSINKVSDSSSNILDVIKVIVNISSQTNMLAMNASIEAAHAGDSGAGFAVVADEIRKLAEDSSNNTKIIKDTLNKNLKDISIAVEINKQAGEYFHRINEKVSEVADAMEEIISGMSELSSGTNEVMKAVTNMLDKSETTNNSVKDLEKIIEGNKSGIKYITELTLNNRKKIEKVVSQFEDIVAENNAINEIGKQNINYIERLGKSLEILKKNEEGTMNENNEEPQQSEDTKNEQEQETKLIS
ncbi:MAG: methyl-accepting chemotaxis protein [Spirochaetota bacterium]